MFQEPSAAVAETSMAIPKYPCDSCLACLLCLIGGEAIDVMSIQDLWLINQQQEAQST